MERKLIAAALIAGPGLATLPVMPEGTAAAASADTAELAGAIVEYDRPPPTFGNPSAETWLKHGDLIRIDHIAEREGRRPHLLVRAYTRPGQPSQFRIGRHADGSLASLHLMRDALSAPPLLADRHFTGQLETRIGETCRVWRRSVPVSDNATFEQSGCTTKDGIELWRRNDTIDAIFARSIRRQPVAAAEVEPPLALLDFETWMTGAPTGSHEHDYEVVMSSHPADGTTRTVRRSGNWEFAHETAPGGSESLTVTNAEADTSLRYFTSLNGDAQLSIDRKLRGHTPQVRAAYRERMTDQPDEIILGERCQWWNMSKGVADSSRAECLTADGAALMIRTYSWGATTTLTATQLKRGPVPLQAILPPRSILSSAFWGFAPSR